jgi:hypothetical protein
MFQASAATLIELAKNPKYVGSVANIKHLQRGPFLPVVCSVPRKWMREIGANR